MARANKLEKKCRVEKHFGMKVDKTDVFYHILASDLRKIEEEKLYGRSDKSSDFFKRRFDRWD
ncbi:MAG: hypothetical protein FWD48_00400 [Oscillospiraceae bacterium]|nr:hypothetical protein [Oscillospiraceae bacterium]